MDSRTYSDVMEPTRSELLWVISTATLQTFLRDLTNGTISGYGVPSFFHDMASYVTKVMYYPIKISPFVTLQSGTLVMGGLSLPSYNVQYDTSGYKTNVKFFSFTPTRFFNNFLDYAPYTQYTLFVPYFEKIVLDPVAIYGHSVDGYISIDFTKGKMRLYIYLDDAILLDSKVTQLGIEISLGKTNAEEINRSNVLQSISLMGSLIGLAVGVATENPMAITGGVALATKSVTTAMANNVSRLTSYTGGSGDRTELSIDKRIRLIIERPQNVTIPDASLKGKPLMTNVALSGLSGYTEIGDIHFNPSGENIFNDEINEIIDLLKSGVIL